MHKQADLGVSMGMSEDAGERWFQLIQSDADLTLIARSLYDRADKLRVLARGRKMSGPQFARARQMLRDEAKQCVVVAGRAVAVGADVPAMER
jgi:hypothetical protein